MKRITQKTINKMVEAINEVRNLDKDNYTIEADFNSAYGGWRLNKVAKNGGGHFGFKNSSGTEARKTTKEFYSYLMGIIWEF